MHPASLALILLPAAFPMLAHADDAPRRKSGLWEITMQIESKQSPLPGQGPIQMCIDQAIDNLARDQSPQKSDCQVTEVKRSGNQMNVRSVCKSGATTATTNAVISGDFDKQYRTEMVTTYSPPRNGVGTMKMTQDARWLGPCKPGQKPGDVIMAGMPPVNANNMQEMMKDPQFREMMKRQQQAR